ncbi:hypothetical protein [uncultured Alistipes sp.]|uniref:hypothetical protein n=1 Tax=uncultured Alistipes sp. TaxID=538949 RepID=UPI0025E67C61|nr:hypothetical protein [uncultured Alistipes sp.]
MKENEKEVFEPLPGEERPTEAEVDPMPQDNDAEALCRARRDVRYGLLWCLGGLAVTLGSYWFAEEGGKYLMATGAIVWGAIQALRGVVNLLRLHYRRGERAAFRRTICTALAAAIVGGVAVWQAVKVTIGEELRLVGHEQRIEIPALRLRMAVPAGYTEVEYETTPETDTTYALHRASAWNERRCITVEGIEGMLRADSVTCVDEMDDYLRAQAEEFFDDGILGEPETVEIGGVRMMKHRGRVSRSPGYIYVFYDLAHDFSLVTLYFSYVAEVPDASVERQAEERLRQLELY